MPTERKWLMRHLILLLAGSLAFPAYAQPGHDLKIETYLLPGETISKSLIAVRLTNITPHELEIPSDNVVIADHPIPASRIGLCTTQIQFLAVCNFRARFLLPSNSMRRIPRR